MNKLRKMLASVLALAMVFTNVSFAANYTDVNAEYSTAVDKLSSLNIINGYEDGTFKPAGELTRAEAAKVLVLMQGKGTAVESAKGKTSQFKDVNTSHWANGFIIVAANAGILKGYADGTFGPEDKVTNDQLITMMVRAIGAGPVAEADVNKTWPANYIALANEINLTKDVNYGAGSSSAVRGDLAKLAENTLEAVKWVRTAGTTKNEVTYQEDANKKTLLSDELDVTVTKNVVLNTTAKTDASYEGNEFKAGATKYELAAGYKVNLDALLGVSVDVWVNDDNDVIRVGKNEDAKETTVSFKEIKKVDLAKNELTVITNDGTEKTYDVLESVSAFINRANADATPDATNDDELTALNALAIKYTTGTVTLDKSGDVTLINATNYDKVILVESIKTTKDSEKIYNNDDVYSSSDLSVDPDADVIVDKNGAVVKFADIKAGNIVLYKNGKNTLLVLENNTVEGTITRLGTDYVTIDGKKYYFNESVNTLANFSSEAKVDNKVKLFLDNAGKIVIVEKLATGTSNYGMVIEAYADEDARGNLTAYMNIMDTTGTKTGVKAVDLDEMEDLFGDLLNDAGEDFDSTDKATLNTAVKKFLGNFVRFENATKLTLTEINSVNDTAALENGDDGDNEIKELTIAEGAKFDVDNNKFTASSSVYRVNDKTIIMIEKTASDTEGGTVTDVEFVKWDAINDVAIDAADDNGLDISVAEVDEDDNTVGFLVVGMKGNDKTRVNASVPRDNSDNTGIVVDIAKTAEAKDYEFTVLVNGKEESFLAKDITGLGSDLTAHIGKKVAYSVANGVVNANALTLASDFTGVKYGKVVKFNNDSIKLMDRTGAITVVDKNTKLFVAEADAINLVKATATSGDITVSSVTDNTLMYGVKVTFADNATANAGLAAAYNATNREVTVTADWDGTALTGLADNAARTAAIKAAINSALPSYLSTVNFTDTAYLDTQYSAGLTLTLTNTAPVVSSVEDIVLADESDIDVLENDTVGQFYNVDNNDSTDVFYYVLGGTGDDKDQVVVMFFETK